MSVRSPTQQLVLYSIQIEKNPLHILLIVEGIVILNFFLLHVVGSKILVSQRDNPRFFRGRHYACDSRYQLGRGCGMPTREYWRAIGHYLVKSTEMEDGFNKIV